MCKVIYSFKAVMLSNKVRDNANLSCLTDEVLDKLRHFVHICVVCYIPWWISSRSPAAAPRNEFSFFHKVNRYKNKVCADAARTDTSKFVR